MVGRLSSLGTTLILKLTGMRSPAQACCLQSMRCPLSGATFWKRRKIPERTTLVRTLLNLAAVSVEDHPAGIQHAGATAAAPTDTSKTNTFVRPICSSQTQKRTG